MTIFQRWPLVALSMAIVITLISLLVYNYIAHYRERTVESILTCTSNVNLNFSEGNLLGPIITGKLYIKLNKSGEGFLEISGFVKWREVTTPISKRINIVHEILNKDGVNLVAIQMIGTFSLDNDQSPQGLIEKFIIGESELSSHVFIYKKTFHNGYQIGSLHSPIAICIDS